MTVGDVGAELPHAEHSTTRITATPRRTVVFMI